MAVFLQHLESNNLGFRSIKILHLSFFLISVIINSYSSNEFENLFKSFSPFVFQTKWEMHVAHESGGEIRSNTEISFPVGVFSL